jgi:hypothetical protein
VLFCAPSAGFVLFTAEIEMVQRFIEIVAEYKERMRAIMPFIDDGSYDRQFMREDSYNCDH